MVKKLLVMGAVALTGTLWSAPAYADASAQTGAAQCGGGYCLNVSYSGSAAPSGGGSRGYVSSVPPLCHYTLKGNPEETYAWIKDLYNTPHYSGMSGLSLLGPLAEFEEAAAKKPKASWYVLDCSIDLKDPRAIAFAGASAMTMGSTDPYARVTRLIPTGTPVPQPLVDPEVLRDAAYESMDIPEPTISRNPEIAGSAATLVNLDTFFWADAYRETWDITASVGPVSATVVTQSEGWVLTSPAGGRVCTQDQFTTPYHPEVSPQAACAISFGRASLGYPGGYPVRATATWGATWTGTPAPAAPEALPPVTTGATVNVPVAESQAVVKSIG